MKRYPPRWADRFLEWYCRPALLEEIQGDAYELFYRDVQDSPTKARCRFVWNILRFFRWKNIKKPTSLYQNSQYQMAMFQNILKISYRQFLRYPVHSFFNITGLTVAFACSFLILLWVVHEHSYDRFHTDIDQVFKVITHVDVQGTIQTHEVAGIQMQVNLVPEVDKMVAVSTGNRWPHELCFRAMDQPNECVYLSGVYAGASFFDVFHFPMVAGEASPLEVPTQIAISEKMAISLFGAEPALGKIIKIDNWNEVTIASVFSNPPAASSLQFDFVMPMAVLQKQWGLTQQQMEGQFFQVFLKTHTLVPPEYLSEKINEEEVMGKALKAEDLRYEAYPMAQWHLKGTFENGKNSGGKIMYLWLFILIGMLVLALAIINFINMATARASLRAKEIGVRKVIGARQQSLIAQFMGEAFLTVVVACLLACLIVQIFLPAYYQLIGEPLQIGLFSWKMLPYLMALLIGVAITAGMYPALIISRLQPVQILKGKATQVGKKSLPLRKILMTTQLSVSCGILLFGGVVVSQLNFMRQNNSGFDRENTLRVEPTYKLLTSYEAFKSELLQQPMVREVGGADTNPLQITNGNLGVEWPGKSPDTRVSINTIGCTPDFPATMGVSLAQGRSFQVEKLTSDSLAGEVLLTEKAVKLMGLDQPLGEVIKIYGHPFEIIGVLKDFHTASLHHPIEPVILYRKPVTQMSALYIKYQPGTERQALEAIQSAFKTVEPTHTMKYWFQDDTYDSLYKPELLAAQLVSIFSLIALLIAVIGMVGLSSFHVHRKIKEISVRRIFGASEWQIMGILFREFTWVILIGSSVALMTALWAASSWLEGFAYHIPLPWPLFVGLLIAMIVPLLAIVHLLGRASLRQNPTESLRID
jgi:putative ABC transport system permease protein